MLNEQQKEAIEYNNGSILVLAGAGTGKTKVLASKIAHVLSNNFATKDEIFSVTFTNHAAKEMRSRIMSMVDISIDFSSWIGTFHSLCLRILKIYYNEVGLKNGFGIIDENDKKQILRSLLKELSLNDEYQVQSIVYAISEIKENDAIRGSIDALSRARDKNIVTIYNGYVDRLTKINAVDFDDLMTFVVKLFDSRTDIADDFTRKFKYIFVDEFQDTNKVQYKLLKHFAKHNPHICCVGDEDQSIYSWRGAEVKNILNFNKDFENVKVVKLTQNYRSSQAILDVANRIITNNTERIGKQLSSDLGEGNKVQILHTLDDREEASKIVNFILNIVQKGEDHSSCAILVRTSHQMRVIEESMISRSIPYKIVGGVRFYDRKEIKDILSFLKIICHDRDIVSFERVVNIPKRGIGDKTVDIIKKEFLSSDGVSIIQICSDIGRDGKLANKAEQGISNFVDIINSIREKIVNIENLSSMIELILHDTKYYDHLASEEDDTSDRVDNIKELLRVASEFTNISDFLDYTALVSSSDVDTNEIVDSISIMTIHAAKGLEFDNVFLPGWEEGLFPNRRVIESGKDMDMEEERRLAYVAITRAKRRLFILSAAGRYMFGKWQSSIPSRFVKEAMTDNVLLISSVSKNYDGFNNNNKNVYSITNNQFKNYTSSKTSINAGDTVRHKNFGRGDVIKKIGQFLEVKFDDGMLRIIKVDFVSKEVK